jgi:hypothetical protein
VLVLLGAAIFLAAWAAPADAGNYRNFSVAVYIPVGITRSMKDPQWLANHWARIAGSLKVDKVYIETYRTREIADEDSIEPIKKFFTDRGIAVAGGLALHDVSQAGQFRSFSYADADDRKYVQHVVELTARHFDEIILDDFFFYSTKTDADIAAKGTRSWTQYRLETMDEVSRDLIVKPAKAINPKLKFVIKYPNWYEHFQGLGYDLEAEPKIFDGIYTGTETRDPVFTEQHLQAYESYEIVRYFDNIAPGRNGGGWVDMYDLKYIDRYAEQLWDTIFAKAPEIMLFNFAALEQTAVAGDRSLWQDLPTSFNYADFAGRPKPSATPAADPNMARAAAYSLEQVDAFAGRLGNPIGIKSYRPPHATGEDFLHNYLGMIGIPIDLCPTFPGDADMMLLTQSAAFDPDIVAKIRGQLVAGKSVVITSGLLRALLGKGIEDICELRMPGDVAAVTDFQGPRGRAIGNTQLAMPILFPQIDFLTNDAWVLVSGMASGNGYPILLMDRYSKGILYVLAVPENFNDLYNLPPDVLAAIRSVLLRNFPVIAQGPAQTSLFAYDNHTMVVESFQPVGVSVSLEVSGDFAHLRDLQSGLILTGRREPGVSGASTRAGEAMEARGRVIFSLQIAPHSYQALEVER